MDQLLEKKMETLERSFSKIAGKMDEMYNALMGSRIAGDGGLVGRILQLEKENELLHTEDERLNKEIESLKAANAKREVYVNIIWAVVGGALVMLVKAVFEHYSK